MKDIYDFNVATITKNEQSLAKYKGKVLLIVNVASECGFTPQYEGLEKLYKTYHDQGFEILAFPCNQLEDRNQVQKNRYKTSVEQTSMSHFHCLRR